MLVNPLRLLGAVKTKKASRHFVPSPTQVILPFSLNHGLFGNDGLYSESKSRSRHFSIDGTLKAGVNTSAPQGLLLGGRGYYSSRTYMGGSQWMDSLPDLAEITTNARQSLNQQAELIIIKGVEVADVVSQLRGMVDLEKMECRGQFTIEGCIEMARIIGHIEHFDGRLPDGILHVGWVDTKSGQPVDDKEIRGKYEQDIVAHAGVRLIEPEIFHEDKARKFKHKHGDKCDIWAGEGGQWFVKMKKGARVFVPKAFSFSRLVAGQIPTGWDAGRYGIPANSIAQVDRAYLLGLFLRPQRL
ncbi:hypothetical protein BD410DRAFT_845780 [Rickenella mellea]|uniref:Uncharacterized protein n=1 Tax=Rickenella mellea TaxID=50990 RepID=A0A4Y7PGY1_9AGAM|nr:hypothetical protein BD410DRAFT_845780 [Rickenella mellea]